MMNEHRGDGEHLVTFKDGRWRFGKRSGSVAASIPIGHHQHFCELAVLVSPGRRVLRYAAPEASPPEARARGPPPHRPRRGPTDRRRKTETETETEERKARCHREH